MKDVQIRPVEARDLAQLVEMIHAISVHHGDTATVDAATLRRDALEESPSVTVLVADMGDDMGNGLTGYSAMCPLAQLQFGVRGWF